VMLDAKNTSEARERRKNLAHSLVAF